jgi:starch synthase
MPKTINVLFLAAEADPFVKVGGLGDVGGALPRALRALAADATGGTKLDVRLVLPLHPVIRTDTAALRPAAIFSMERDGAEIPVQVFETSLDGMPVYFINGDPISSVGSVYSSNPTLDAEKYCFFSLAAIEMLKVFNWEPDVIHANDWHAALSLYSVLLKHWNNQMEKVVSVLTVHNLPFMGPDLSVQLPSFGFPLAQSDLPYWSRSMPLPLGLWSADAIVAVSPSYGREILGKEYGCGLDEFLLTRKDQVSGILNGIDMQSFDPATDAALAQTFNAETLVQRANNKAALQEVLGLPVDPNLPLIGSVTRMDPQKGIDLVPDALRKLSDLPWQLVVLGTGDPKLEAQARRLQADFPDRVRAELKYDASLARQIYAGSDMLLMPSRYEPCGLAQMIAMRYGCVPIVRATGGLNDTVVHGQTGFLFQKASASALAGAIREALDAYPDHDHWMNMQLAGMAQDFSWANSALQYFELYQSLLDRKQ